MNNPKVCIKLKSFCNVSTLEELHLYGNNNGSYIHSYIIVVQSEMNMVYNRKLPFRRAFLQVIDCYKNVLPSEVSPEKSTMCRGNI